MKHHGWWILAVLSFTLCSVGCAKKEGWASFPVLLYADHATTSSSLRTADLSAALEFWETKAGRKLFDFRGEWKDGTPYTGSVKNIESVRANVILFVDPWPFALNIAGQTT